MLDYFAYYGIADVAHDPLTTLDELTRIQGEGNVEAIRAMVDYFLTLDYGGVDIQKLVELLTSAAQNNVGFAEEKLAEAVLNGYYGLERDGQRVLELLEGNPDTANVLALRGAAHYYGTEKSVQDLEKASDLLTRAAQLGSPLADQILGVAYSSGRGFEKNLVLGLSHLEKATLAGDRSQVTISRGCYPLTTTRRSVTVIARSR